MYALNEEAPVIVGVIDERAPEVLMKQEYKESGKWKSLSSSKDKKKNIERSPSVQIIKSKKEVIDLVSNRRDSSDTSPPRKQRRNSDNSPPRQSRRRKDSSDASPPRRRPQTSNESQPRRRREDSDESPPRQSRRKGSPDSSPPRRERQRSRPRTVKVERDSSPPRRRRDSDNTPPRRNRRDSDNTPPRRNRRNSDNTPPRRDRRSPERRKRSRWSPKRESPARKVKTERDFTPPKRLLSPKKDPHSPPRTSKMTKTLDGKNAGLQDAKELKRENEAYRKRQEDMFKNLDPSISGRNAKDIAVRDARGRNREYSKNHEQDRKKAEAEEKRKEQYDVWNRGVKQREEMEKRRQEFIHEASKPLARAADDADLEEHLKDQERIDDPMLEYMRSKKKKRERKAGVLERPEYSGSFPDNRFGIKPGYRWDGVDRSNGYEKKLFEVRSSKIAQQEEAYLYSVEDM